MPSRATVAAAAALALGIAVTGCTGSGSGSTSPATPPDASARVGLIDFEVVHRPSEVLPGAVVLRATNTGATLHDLVVQGKAGQWRTPHLRPGEQAELVVTARPGEVLDLWCSVGGHDAAGMRSTLPVVVRPDVSSAEAG